MPLEVPFPLPPMEALSVDTIPEGGDWQYEPKWDGFRCLAFRDGGSVQLQSRSLQPLARYFPEVAEALAELDAESFRPRWRNRRSGRTRLFVRCASPANSPGSFARQATRGRDAGDLRRV